MTEETKTIRQMCDEYDVTPRTLRFYEAKELLFPTRDGQKRLFTKRDGARLKLILRGLPWQPRCAVCFGGPRHAVRPRAA